MYSWKVWTLLLLPAGFHCQWCWSVLFSTVVQLSCHWCWQVMYHTLLLLDNAQHFIEIVMFDLTRVHLRLSHFDFVCWLYLRHYWTEQVPYLTWTVNCMSLRAGCISHRLSFPYWLVTGSCCYSHIEREMNGAAPHVYVICHRLSFLSWIVTSNCCCSHIEREMDGAFIWWWQLHVNIICHSCIMSNILHNSKSSCLSNETCWPPPSLSPISKLLLMEKPFSSWCSDFLCATRLNTCKLSESQCRFITREHY